MRWRQQGSGGCSDVAVAAGGVGGGWQRWRQLDGGGAAAAAWRRRSGGGSLDAADVETKSHGTKVPSPSRTYEYAPKYVTWRATSPAKFGYSPGTSK